MITVIAGGVGAAGSLRGARLVVADDELTAIVNVGDDTELHGLHISPDLDTVVYTLAGAVDPATGWGLTGETWTAMDALDRYGGETWFRLGDQDLATHLHRTHQLRAGASLSSVTASIAAAWELGLTVLPATDDRLRTRLVLADGPEVEFQDYFVRRQHDVAISSIRFDGASTATPAPGVLASIDAADVVIIAPSNPLVSIDPVLAIAPIRAALEARRSTVVAVSPIVGGAALKGPADRMLRELGHEPSALGVASHLAEVAGTMVIDDVDAALAPAIEAIGVHAVVTDTIMRDAATSAALATTAIEAAR